MLNFYSEKCKIRIPIRDTYISLSDLEKTKQNSRLLKFVGTLIH